MVWDTADKSYSFQRSSYVAPRRMVGVEDGKEDEGDPMVAKTAEPSDTVDFYNKRSRIVHVDDEEKMVFLFDYRGEDGREVITWNLLKRLKDANKWGLLRHPLILNFINDRLVDCALFYLAHIIAFFSFLILLSSHIFSKDIYKDILVTIFLVLFFFFMLLKGSIKARISKSISTWFVVAYTFNLLTFVATFGYIWIPYLFEYDDFHQELKNIILWALPIIAVLSAWVNFLYILRKSPYGIYIFMMVRILKSFGHVATIWIPTLIAFSFAFHLILRDSGVEPWESADNANATTLHKLFVILQAVTKTSTMMIGEVDADNILGTRQWIPSILILVFEIITVILLMNLMVSLAVGDVNDLRNTSQDKILRIKLNFVVEALQLAEALEDLCSCFNLHRSPTHNVLVVNLDGSFYSAMKGDVDKIFDERRPSIEGRTQSPSRFEPYGFKKPEPTSTSDLVFHVGFSRERIRLRVHRRPHMGRNQEVSIEGCQLSLRETPESGIPEHKAPLGPLPPDEESCGRKAKQWLIGLDWPAYLELY